MGDIIAVFGPTGVGKSTLVEEYSRQYDVPVAQMVTTRQPRSAEERERGSYTFLDNEGFNKSISSGQAVLPQHYDGNRYAWIKQSLTGPLEQGKDVLTAMVGYQWVEDFQRTFGNKTIPVCMFAYRSDVENFLLDRKGVNRAEVRRRLQQVEADSREIFAHREEIPFFVFSYPRFRSMLDIPPSMKVEKQLPPLRAAVCLHQTHGKNGRWQTTYHTFLDAGIQDFVGVDGIQDLQLRVQNGEIIRTESTADARRVFYSCRVLDVLGSFYGRYIVLLDPEVDDSSSVYEKVKQKDWCPYIIKEIVSNRLFNAFQKHDRPGSVLWYNDPCNNNLFGWGPGEQQLSFCHWKQHERHWETRFSILPHFLWGRYDTSLDVDSEPASVLFSFADGYEQGKEKTTPLSVQEIAHYLRLEFKEDSKREYVRDSLVFLRAMRELLHEPDIEELYDVHSARAAGDGKDGEKEEQFITETVIDDGHDLL